MGVRVLLALLMKDLILKRLKETNRICREEFLTESKGRKRNNQFKELNRIFQELVQEGILYTVDRGGDYTFFQHHGRTFPKMWNRRD